MNEAQSGLGLPAVLTVVFIVLKLCEVIDWSWIWVLSPIWITLLAVLGIAMIAWVTIQWAERDRKD